MERVQVFTNPLYTLLIAGFYGIIYDRSWLPNPHRMWIAAMVLSYLFSVAVIIELWCFSIKRSAAWVTFCILMTSQAYVSFCSSGLETSLTYLLASTFYLFYLNPKLDKLSLKMLSWYTLLVSFSMLNRLDTILLLFPAWLHIFSRTISRYGLRAVAVAGVSFLPIFVWLGFAIVYFGFFLPNSYFAKLGLNLPPLFLFQHGIDYAFKCFQHDPVTLTTIILSTSFSILFYIKKRDPRFFFVQIASTIYAGYVIKIGGDFLGYRFFSAPFLLSSITLVHYLFQLFDQRYYRRILSFIVLLCAMYSILLPSSPLRILRETPTQPDVQYYFRGSALRYWRPGRIFPFSQFHAVVNNTYGHQMRADSFRVSITGGGIRGFVRGPKDHLIDPQSITDPLIARLPVSIKKEDFAPAHFLKPIPAGYVESVYENENLIVDTKLGEYYRKLRMIISGPVWSKERWKYIYEFNLTPLRRYNSSYIIQDPPYPYDKR